MSGILLRAIWMPATMEQEVNADQPPLEQLLSLLLVAQCWLEAGEGQRSKSELGLGKVNFLQAQPGYTLCYFCTQVRAYRTRWRKPC